MALIKLVTGEEIEVKETFDDIVGILRSAKRADFQMIKLTPEQYGTQSDEIF